MSKLGCQKANHFHMQEARKCTLECCIYPNIRQSSLPHYSPLPSSNIRKITYTGVWYYTFSAQPCYICSIYYRFLAQSFCLLLKISWTDHVRNEEVLLRVKEQRNILHEICKRKANWIGHILRRNCLLQRVIEGKIRRWIEVTGRQGRRCRKLLDDLKERRGYSHLEEEALDRTMWRARFGRGFGPVVKTDC